MHDVVHEEGEAVVVKNVVPDADDEEETVSVRRTRSKFVDLQSEGGQRILEGGDGEWAVFGE